MRVVSSARRVCWNGPRIAVSLFLAASLSPLAQGQTNLALRKPATQSSTYAADYPAAMCVDGNRTSGFCHTDIEANPWWQVDLGGNYALSQIVVYNRTDGWGERERTIRALLSTDGRTWTAIYSHDGSDFSVLPINAGGRSARYVRLQLAATEYMNIQEVEVFGGGGSAPSPSSSGNWSPVGTGDCPGTDVGGSTGPNPEASWCTASFSGFTAVCWGQGCTYKHIATSSCTGGASPGRMYTCTSGGSAPPPPQPPPPPPPPPPPSPSVGNWRPVGTGDCPGNDSAGSTGPNPDPSFCTASYNGFTAVCWSQGCTYKHIATSSCTGGASPGRMYTCASGSASGSGGGSAAPLDLGATLTVVHPNVCVAIWTRTRPGVYDAVTVCQGPGNSSFREVLTVESNDGRNVVISRPNYGRYRGTLSADRKTITGTCDWAGCSPGFDWIAYVDRDWRNSPPLK